MSRQTISHALLDRVLEILAKNPIAWSHADDLFMLSIYKGSDKAELVRLVQQTQGWQNTVNAITSRLEAKTGKPQVIDTAAVPALLRPRLAAGVDWQMLMGPVKRRFWELFVGSGKIGARATSQIEYHDGSQQRPSINEAKDIDDDAAIGVGRRR